MIAEAIGAGMLLFANQGSRRSLLSSERLASACVALAYLAWCMAVQIFSGSWHAAFLAYPDEPSHFVGAAMIRDWLVSGPWFAPLGFATNYYEHYPYFAVGYWPPLFSVVTGFWMLLTGVGRTQALLIPAVFAAGSGWLLFQFVRRRMGMVAGICAGAVYLSLPTVQQWMCAVMVDHMTAFLCLAAAAALIRYLKNPILWNGVLCGAVCGCAVLSKYSAAYIVALPLATIVLTRRFGLLRKPSFLVQPLLIAVMVGPWALWTRGLARYGLPSEREALTAGRVGSFLLETFKIFPPVLLAIVILGLIAAVVMARPWRDDLIVLALLGAGHLSFLILSPVGAEHRYLMVPAAVLLVAAFVGGSGLLAWAVRGGDQNTVLATGMAVATLLFAVFEFSHMVRFPPDRIARVVALIVKDPARSGQRILVPPTLEGAVIADFVAQRRDRTYSLVRPIKKLASGDWFGGHYSSKFENCEQMMEYFRQEPVDLIMWDASPESTLRPHARILGEMLRRYPLTWVKVPSSDPVDGPQSLITLYDYRAEAGRDRNKPTYLK